MLGKIEDKRKRRQRRVRWLDDITNSIYMKVKVAQLGPTLCNPMDCSTPGPCPSPTPRVYSNSSPLSQRCHPTICYPFFLLPSVAFPMSQFFASGDQSIGASASASVLPMNIQDWFPLGWTGWISFKSKGLSRVFSNTQSKNISSLAVSFLYGPTLTSIHDYWKKHSFDKTDVCWQSNVSAFEYAV